MLEAWHLRKEYPGPDGGRVVAMAAERLSIKRGEQIAVVGPSGSGKTTLLSILAGVLAPTAGEMLWNGEPWGRNRGGMTARERARRVGFIFQDLNLLPSLTLFENLLIAGRILGVENSDAKIRPLLERVALADKGDRKPGALSRGERQRAAIARAMLHVHPLVVADEPTASLDGDNAARAMDMLCALARENRSTLVVATHDPRVMERLERRMELRPAERPRRIGEE